MKDKLAREKINETRECIGNIGLEVSQLKHNTRNWFIDSGLRHCDDELNLYTVDIVKSHNQLSSKLDRLIDYLGLEEITTQAETKLVKKSKKK